MKPAVFSPASASRWRCSSGRRTSACTPLMNARPAPSVYLSSRLTVAMAWRMDSGRGAFLAVSNGFATRPRPVSRHRSSVVLRWPSKRIAVLHRLPIQLGMGKRCALLCAPMAARSLRHLIGDATLALHRSNVDVTRPERIHLDEVPPWLDLIAHQHREHAIGLDGVVDLHAQQAAHARVHRGFP